MTVDELRQRRRELTAERERLRDGGAGELEIQLVSEELLDVNANLRRLTPGHRVGGKRAVSAGDGAAIDRMQYKNWEAMTWNELADAGLSWEEIETGPRRLREVVKNAADILTPTEKKYFDLLAAGKKQKEIAALCGVDDSAVSRRLASAKRKLRDAAEHMARTDGDYAGPGVRIDAAEPETAKMLLSACTAKQIVYLYLYYGEWLSCGEIGRLLDIDKTAALRGVTRGLAAVGRLFPGKAILLDNMDALGDVAYALYNQRDYSDEDLTPSEPERGFAPGAAHDWGRRKLGLASPARHENYADRPPIIAGASDGRRQDVRVPRRETAGGPKGKLLAALLERWRKAPPGENRGSALRRWLLALFEKLKEPTMKQALPSPRE